MSAAPGLARAIWIDVPERLVRRIPWLAAVLSDGSYLIRWPLLAILAPLASFLVGFAIGGYRFFGDESYVSSIIWPLLLFVPAGFGAALGLEATLGFAIGDLFLFPHLYPSTGIADVWFEQVPLLITYEVLLGLTVLLPMAAQPLAAGITRLFGRRLRGSAAVIAFVAMSAAVAAMLALAWTSSAQVLVRPIESFRGGFPSPALVQPLRQQGVFLILLAAVLTIARLAIERAACRDLMVAAAGSPAPSVQRPQPDGRTQSRRWRWQMLKLVIWTALATLLLSGLLDEPWQALPLFGALLVSGLLRKIILPRARPYARFIGRVPVLLRLIVLSIVGYVVGIVVLPLLIDDPPFLPLSWAPMVAAASITIVIAAFLLPGPPLDSSSPDAAPSSPRQEGTGAT